MSILRATCAFAISAACTSGPVLGGIVVNNPADPISDLNCGVGFVAADVGWSLAFACVGDQSATFHCSDLDVTNSMMLPLGMVLTKAAVAEPGNVPLTIDTQTADVASVAFTYMGTALGSGAFTSTAVVSTLTANFDAECTSTEFNYESGSITDVPYCP